MRIEETVFIVKNIATRKYIAGLSYMPRLGPRFTSMPLVAKQFESFERAEQAVTVIKEYWHNKAKGGGWSAEKDLLESADFVIIRMKKTHVFEELFEGF